MPNSQIPYIGDNVCTVYALCNDFRPPFVINADNDQTLAERMVALAKTPSKLNGGGGDSANK